MTKLIIHVPLCTNAYTDIPGAPVNVRVTNVTPSTIGLSWSPPLVSETLGLAIYSYTITCSRGLDDDTHMKTTDGHSVMFSQFLPFTQYNCCVRVNSENGPGVPACLSATTGEQLFCITANNITFEPSPFQLCIQMHITIEHQKFLVIVYILQLQYPVVG